MAAKSVRASKAALSTVSATCGCGVKHVSAAGEGQVRGLQKMVEKERYCADVMTQIASMYKHSR